MFLVLYRWSLQSVSGYLYMGEESGFWAYCRPVYNVLSYNYKVYKASCLTIQIIMFDLYMTWTIVPGIKA